VKIKFADGEWLEFPTRRRKCMFGKDEEYPVESPEQKNTDDWTFITGTATTSSHTGNYWTLLYDND
jgi:hypothetical protein